MAQAAPSAQAPSRRGHSGLVARWSNALASYRRGTQAPAAGRLCARALAIALLVFASGVSAAGGVVRTPVAPLQIGAGSVAAPAHGALSVDIAPQLVRQLASGGRRDFAIEFREHADLSAAHSLDWNARGRYVVERLRQTAQRSQGGVQRLLGQRGVSFHSLWIKNAILVEQGDIATLQAAAGFAEVARIRELPKAELIKPEQPAVAARAATSGVADNIAWVGADRVWNEGTTGDGVTVGIIDDGVFYRHEAVVNQYRGNLGSGGFQHDYNWYAPTMPGSEPNGSQGEGHGTHVTGTIVGDNHAADPAQRQRIGIAPGATWIACLGLPMKGSDFALPACGQFMLAPTRADGSDPDPDRRPQVVNNSWGNAGLCDGSADDFYRDIVEAWVAAGIFPVFAAGNASNCGLPETPGLSTVMTPASLGSAFAVGSSGNHDGQYAPHSLWGPSLEASPGLPGYPDPRGYPTLKPQVVAPGVDIRSAIDGGNGYATMTGTSMSAPHISGLVALMLEAGECLRGDYATLGGLIMQSARPIDYASGGEPPPGLGNVPNYATGWGEIDASRAVDAAAHACGPQGSIRGKVTSASGAPIGGATIEIFVDETVRIHQTTSAADGSYVRRLPVDPGSGYTVRVSAYGYLPAGEAGVPVQVDATTRHDVQLATAATYKISGRVTDAATGWPLHAKIAIGSGFPSGSIWSDAVSGAYSVRLPEGRAYRFDVGSDIAGYQPASRELASVSGGGAQDFALAADRIACTAPGYAYATTLLSEDFENNGTVPPTGWSASSAGLGWLFGNSANLSTPMLFFPQHGRFAAANDGLGASDGWDNDGRADYLQLPPSNLAGLVHPVLRYRSYFIDSGSRAHVEASSDGGATWRALGSPTITTAMQGWTDEALDLSSVAVANLRLRFHSDDGTTDEFSSGAGGWAVDDVAIQGACSAPANGGLVVGHVRDANTGAGLNGAAVRVAAGTPTATVSSADPGVGDGFFALHAPAGTPSVSADRGTQPAGYGDASATPNVANGGAVLVDLALPAGRLRLYPGAPAASVELGTTATVPFKVGNSGTLPLNFGFEGAAVEEHFEGATFPPDGWRVENAGAGCGWIALDPSRFGNTAGGDGGAAMVYPFPCWDGADSDTVLISPRLDLSTSHTASMGFFLSLFDGADSFPRLDVDASADGGTTWTTVHSETHDNSNGGLAAPIELDLSAFAGASDARVRFHYTATPPWGFVIVDQIHLFNTISASAMLHLAPDYGTLAVGESRTLDATFDARNVSQPGLYTLPIRVAEDTPYAWPFGDVEATMTVTAPASYGSLGGRVQSLGYCDANPRTLGGATITIHATGGQTYTTTSASDGSYRYWIEAAQGPFTVTVAAADHQPVTQSFAIAAGVETAADVDVRALQACLSTDPAQPAATVGSGQTAQLAFDLLNTGAAAADWTLRSGGDPAVLSRVPLVQTTSPTPEENVSFSCVYPKTGYSLENRYLRRFDLAERGVPIRDTTIGGISFAIDSATSSTGTQPITVRVYSLDGDLTLEHLQLLSEKTVDVADGTLERVRVAFDQPVQVAGDSVLVAEIFVPNGLGSGNAFYPGGNSEGETASGYWVARDCGASEPMAFADAGLGWVNLILELDTLASDPCGADATPVDWLAVSASGGAIGADAGVPLQATFSAGNHADGDYRGSMCAAPGRTPANPVAIAVTMRVGNAGDSIFANGFD